MIQIERAHHPLIVVQLLGELTMDDIEVQRAAYREIHALQKRFAMLVDTRGAKLPNAVIRRALGELSHEFGDATKRDVVTVMIILGNPLMAGVFQAIRWFISKDLDYNSRSSAKDGLAYIKTMLEREGLKLPGEADTLARRLDDRRA